jgi:hypothetical protein
MMMSALSWIASSATRAASVMPFPPTLRTSEIAIFHVSQLLHPVEEQDCKRATPGRMGKHCPSNEF